jgi:dTDP-4-dehydrorhamnose 3,5-epimerase
VTVKITQSALPDVKLIHLDLFRDERGAFAETYDLQKFAALGIDYPFLQDSWSHSAKAGTIRGLHFQAPPRAQHKLVRVIRGRLLDVVVDIRRDSPTFGQHVSFDLSADQPLAVLVPMGFAHGFCTLEDDTEITYKMSDHFVPDLYMGLNWGDPALQIKWPVEPAAAIVSEKDLHHPNLADLPPVF